MRSPFTKDFDTVFGLLDETDLDESFCVDDVTVVEASFEVFHVDRDDFLGEDVVEASLRKTSLKGHLAAFETDTLGITGSRLLTLVTLTGGLALSGSGTTADPFDVFLGTLCRGKFV